MFGIKMTEFTLNLNSNTLLHTLNLPGSEASLVCHLFFLASHSVCLHSSFSLGPGQKDNTSVSYPGLKQKNMCQKQRIPPSVSLAVYNVGECIVTETLRFLKL